MKVLVQGSRRTGLKYLVSKQSAAEFVVANKLSKFEALAMILICRSEPAPVRIKNLENRDDARDIGRSVLRPKRFCCLLQACNNIID